MFYDRIQQASANFNSVFGPCQINAIKPIDIENYQIMIN